MNKKELDKLINNSKCFEEKFNVWRKYSKKFHWDYMLWDENSNPIWDFVVNEYCPEIAETITYEKILSNMEHLLKDNEITKEKYDEIRASMIETNFGSMVFGDW